MDNRWNNLSMSEKNQLLGIYVSKGYTDLASIINHYNSFATGGQMNTDGPKEDKNKKKSDEPPVRTYNIPMVQPMVSTIDPMGGIGYQATYFTHEQEMRRAAAEAEAQRREAERIARQPVLRADTRTQADRDRAAKQRKQDEYNRVVNEQKDRLMSIGRPNTESTQAAILAMPYVAEAAKNYVQNFDPTAEIRSAVSFIPGISNVMMAQDADQAFDNGQVGVGILNALLALTPMFGVTPNFKSPLRYTRPANRVGDWTILDYGRNTTTTPVQSSATPMLNMPNSLRLSSVERPSLSARPTQGRIGTTNRLQLPETTESFRALEETAYQEHLNDLYRNSNGMTSSEIFQLLDDREADLEAEILEANRPTLNEILESELPDNNRYEIASKLGIRPQIKPLIRGAEIEKQLSKAGTISRKSLDAYIAKQGKYYQDIMQEVLESDFKGVDKIDYVAFQDAVQRRLPEYNRIPQTRYQDYGAERLHLNHSKQDVYDFARQHDFNIKPGSMQDVFVSPDGEIYYEKDILDFLEEYDPIQPTFNTFTFETSGIKGNNKHYGGEPIGHSRTYTTKKEPNVLYVMESQSDWGQARYYDKKGNAYNRTDYIGIDYEEARDREKEFLTSQQIKQKDEFTERQIQENLRYAAEQGQTKMRYPTRETAVKIEGYPEDSTILPEELQQDFENFQKEYDNKVKELQQKYLPKDYYSSVELENILYEDLTPEEYKRLIKISKDFEISKEFKKYKKELEQLQTPSDWYSTHAVKGYNQRYETILKKYDAFPKQFQKLFGKKAEVRTVTDSKGNTWYEVDIPESYKNKTGQIVFANGGHLGHVIPSHKFQYGNSLSHQNKVVDNWMYNWYNNRVPIAMRNMMQYEGVVAEPKDLFKNLRITQDLLNNALYNTRKTPTTYAPLPPNLNGVYRDDRGDILLQYDAADDVLIHEKSHALHDFLGNRWEENGRVMQDAPFWEAIGEVTSDDLYEDENGKYIYDEYLDDVNEIYSRLMQIRYNNNLDPRHRYTIKEIQDLRRKGKLNLPKSDGLERYTDKFIQHLFNEVADNSVNNTLSNIAAKGGTLSKVTPYGQWQYPGKVTTIPSNNITMKGVDYPVIGVSNTGDTKYMLPNMDYLFDGQYVTEYPINSYQKGGKPTRIRRNDGSTQSLSEKIEDRTAEHIQRFNAEKINHNYDIPYIPEKEISIPKVGRVSTNVLDSIAKYANMANIPLSEGLGLAAQESVFGAIPYFNYGTNANANRALGNSSYLRNYGSIPANYLVRDWHYFDLTDKQRATTPPLLDAFQYWKTGKYNRGDKNHTSDVRAKGKQVINSAPVQEWMKTSPYVKKKTTKGTK